VQFANGEIPTGVALGLILRRSFVKKGAKSGQNGSLQLRHTFYLRKSAQPQTACRISPLPVAGDAQLFSGIVEEVGVVQELVDSADGRSLKIGAKTLLSDAVAGASISVNGVCLTVVSFAGDWFCVDAVHETLRRTTLGDLERGSKVNLERALRLSDRLGGHLVSGHIDSIATVTKIEPEGFSRVISFSLSKDLAPFFVAKGSVTVIDLEEKQPGADASQFIFRVALIPHTMEVTTLGQLAVGTKVNIETDMVARYVARLALPYLGENLNKEHANLPFLLERS
jgi:riboflavin synthase